VARQILLAAWPRLSRSLHSLIAMAEALQPGDELRCPHCRHWHPVTISSVRNTTTSADQML
jgi:hypothetical protein